MVKPERSLFARKVSTAILPASLALPNFVAIAAF
jgi:hypothetical protein